MEHYSQQNRLTNRVRDVYERQPISRRLALTTLGAGVAGIAGVGGQALGVTRDFADGKGDPDDPYQIANWHHLDNVRTKIDDGDSFELIQDLDSGTDGYEKHVNGPSNGFDPIGPDFTGTFDGNGHTISDLVIDGSSQYVGLFTEIAGTVKNLTLADADVDNSDSGTGVLAGLLTGTAQNVAVSDSNVIGSSSTGGLVGVLGEPTDDDDGTADDGTVQNVSVSGSGTVESQNAQAGGIAGVSGGGSVSGSSTAVNVKGTRRVGGLIGGIAADTNITASRATGIIEGTELDGRLNGQSIGGLVGDTLVFAVSGGLSGNLIIEESYTTATVRGTENVGGLLGNDVNGGKFVKIKQSYSTANIESTGDPDLNDEADDYQKNIGGLVGKGAPDIDNSYAASTITTNADGTGDGAVKVGGVIGAVGSQSETEGTDTYWDIVKTGESSAVGDGSLTATGLTPSEMQGTAAETNMSGLIDSGAWQIVGIDPISGGYGLNGYPILSALERDPQLEAQGITPPVAAIEINADNATIKNSTITVDEDT